jgi:hypothetical protein
MTSTITRLSDHTPKHAAEQFRTLAYRSHVIRPNAGGIAFVEACIEEQLARILDEADADTALQLLAIFNPALSVERVESLLDLADEVARTENSGSRQAWHCAIDDYCDELHRIALDVRRCNARAVSR